jgi:hypothetical protein
MKTRKAPRSKLDITILKQGIPSKHVLSTSFFTMKDAYRPLGQYQYNVIRFLKQKNSLKGFETRIYTDDTGKDFLLDATKTDPTITIIHVQDARFRDGSGHIGTFATFLRFLPLFEPGLKTVWVSDIDIPDSYLNPSLLLSMKARKAEFSYMSFVCYDKKVYGRAYTILAGTMISFHTFPKQLFTKFLTLLHHPTKALQHMIDQLNKINTERNKPSSKIPYGMDEVFTNGPLYNYLMKESIPCLIRKDYEYARTYLYGIRTKQDDQLFEAYYRNPTQYNFEQVKRIFKQKLPLLPETHACIQEMLRRMDSFKTSFVKTFVKTGKELDTIEA